MAAKLKTPLDLELNLFENSFASKDLLHAHAKADGAAGVPAAEASARSTATSLESQHSLLMDHSSASGASSEMLEIKARSTVPPANLQRDVKGDSATKTQPESQIEGQAEPQPELRLESLSGSNKHNLRILNFNSVNSERLPGLTPPVFTPGGRRLPPIHLLPGLGMASPGTPGSNLWSSLLTATNGVGTGQASEQHPGMYAPPNYPLYMRKSGLIPTESNLRTGLTPGLMNHTGFNFNIQDGMANGQMTPGLQTLLGLVNNHPAEPSGMPVPPALANTAQKTAKNSAGGLKVKAEAKEEGKDLKEDDEGLDEEEKRKQFLERNRVAALKCRQRKKQQLTKMESELAFYSDGYRDLTAQVAQLRDQVMVLRGLVLNHKDCPALLNSVGGYQQLQNILAQAEFVALGKNTEHSFVPMAAGMPPMMANSQPAMKHAEPVVMNSQDRVHPVDHQVNGMGSHGLHDMHLPHSENVVNQHGRDQIAFDADLAMNRQFALANGHHSGIDMHLQKDNLRTVNSTSNLQHVKHENNISSYDLRPIASMVDLQHQNHNAGLMARQFQL
ncbi:hypothetical protein HF325_000871 [Metschnikowia pulcherrima]|uniref:BZIP domain-containing protein n=1 Tax=Metschnikowia pulcherrima TaxID=27326 RepID=A0A8H7LEC9_9ASCO|nr:hypothetical protein HF325_000871 [Metschnikowia pulcherrima]